MRKPLYVEPKNKGTDITADMLNLQRVAAHAEANKKADDISAHLGDNVDVFVTAEEDDDEFRFFLNVTVDL